MVYWRRGKGAIGGLIGQLARVAEVDELAARITALDLYVGSCRRNRQLFEATPDNILYRAQMALAT